MRPRGIEKTGAEPPYRAAEGVDRRRWMLTVPESREREPFHHFNGSPLVPPPPYVFYDIG